MRFAYVSALLLCSGTSIHAFSPQHAATVAKNAILTKPAFLSAPNNNPLDGIKLPVSSVDTTSIDGLVKEMQTLLQTSSDSLTQSLSTLVSSLESALQKADLPVPVLEESVQKLQNALNQFLSTHPELQPIYNGIQQQVEKLSLDQVPSSVILIVSAVLTYSIISSLLSTSDAPPTSPYPTGKYNATSARAYFDTEPLQVIQRGIQVTTNSLGFGISLLVDYAKYVVT